VTDARPALRVGAYAVIERDSAVLLARWIGSDPPRWTLPGGGLDHGEDPRDGAVREVEEETGYRVSLGRVLTVESFRELVRRPDGLLDHQAICIIYAAEVVGGQLRDEIGGSTDTAAWFPLADVPTLTRGGLVDLGLAAAGHLPAGAEGQVG
jgi:8-oxo-dGTP diphosphatase